MVLFIILLLWLREGCGGTGGSRPRGDIQDVKPEERASAGASVHISVYGPAMMSIVLRRIHTLPGAQTHTTQLTRTALHF